MRWLSTFFAILCMFVAVEPFAQTAVTLGNSNYAGIQGAYLQPASLADNRLKFDINLFSAGASFSNNYLSFDSRLLTQWNRWDGFMNETFKSEYVSQQLTGKDKRMANWYDANVLSFFFTMSPKHALGVSFRSRGFINVDQIDEDLAQILYEGSDFSDLYNIPIDNGNLNTAQHSWNELGFTYAREAYRSGPHYIKAGVTMKLLFGAATSYVYGENLQLTLPNQDSLFIANGSLSYQYGTMWEGNDPSNSFGINFNRNFFDHFSMGADIGIVYEFRPDHPADEKLLDQETFDRDQNKYKLKVGISLLDIGRIRYDAGSGSGRISAQQQQIAFDDFNNVNGYEDLENTLNNLFGVTDISGEPIRSNLPTALSVQVDYHVTKGLYVNFTPYISMVNGFKRSQKIHDVSTFFLTPRYEMRWFEFGLPLSMDVMEGFQAGVNMRLGPLFVGSNNLLSPLLGKKSFSSAHAYAGLRVPIAFKKQKDKDNDGVPDEVDRCPDLPGDFAFGGCPDTDGDGISDDQDRCPEEFGLPALEGCPELDSDGDGIADADDECPQVAGIDTYGGCPFEDADEDGIPDQDDACPELFGLAAFQGCPDSVAVETSLPIDTIAVSNDADLDSVPDISDECPYTKGPVENKGCPLIKEAEQEVVDEAFENLEFEVANARMKTSSLPYMNRLAELLIAHPEWNLSVKGHTDNIGSREFNMNLSKERAESVQKFLVSAGVNADRIHTEWFGPDKPIATNETQVGRSKNRRVELDVFFD